MQRIIQFWKSGIVGKFVIGCGSLVGLILICAICGILFGREPSREVARTPTPTAAIAKTEATATPEAREVPPATDTPCPTGMPTLAPVATDTPRPTETPTPALVATDTPGPTETPTSVPVPTYQIVEVEDISVAHAVRFRVKAITEFPISVEQINGLCEQVVENLKSQESLNAVVVFLYDTRSLWSDAYSIAKCEYAPNGVWADAVNVQTGDYSTHKFTYEYQPKVNDSQVALSERPTEQEHNLCQQWDKLSLELLSESDDVAAAETIAYEQIAEKNGVSVQTVEDAVFKCTVWTWR
jgi:hypothetical protein